MQKNSKSTTEFLCILGMTNFRSSAGHLYISLNPWLYDDALTEEECIMWKLKDTCHVCGMSVKFHRDDCAFSYSQLCFASIAAGEYTLDTRNYTLTKNKNV